MTERLTFDHTREWLSEIKEHTEDDIVIMLIGNKYDLIQEDPGSRVVSENEAITYARSNGLLYNETSAKTGYNIKEVFESLVESKKFQQILVICIEIYEKQKEKKFNKEEEEEEALKVNLENAFRNPENGKTPNTNQKACCG